jgi:hypothetical protein
MEKRRKIHEQHTTIKETTEKCERNTSRDQNEGNPVGTRPRLPFAARNTSAPPIILHMKKKPQILIYKYFAERGSQNMNTKQTRSILLWSPKKKHSAVHLQK